MRLIDSHAHIDASAYADDREEVIARAREAGLEHVVLIALWREGEGVSAVRAGLELARRHRDFLSPAVCVHPHDVQSVSAEENAEIEVLAALPEVVAIGETGLDYYYDHSPREEQKEAFRRWLRLAHTLNKPVIIHTRDADEDTLAIIDELGVPARGGVIHCFSGTPEAAAAYLERGLHISFSGIATFRNAEPIREAARLVPLERMMVETDAPYLAPVPKRGKRNEPAWVTHVATALAEVKGLSQEEFASATTETARKFFGLG